MLAIPLISISFLLENINLLEIIRRCNSKFKPYSSILIMVWTGTGGLKKVWFSFNLKGINYQNEEILGKIQEYEQSLGWKYSPQT